MYLDDGTFSAGGGEGGKSCRSCKQPIAKGERATRLEFNNDPSGVKGLTGAYHLACSKPFASLAHIVNMNPWGGR